MEEIARSIQERLWSSLVGSLTLALRELIDGLSSDCHDDSSPRKYQNVYVVLAYHLIAGYIAVVARTSRFKNG
jgi:hypothetical protein